MTAEGLTGETLPAETGGGATARQHAAGARQLLQNPPSSNQSRALIKSTLNCLCNSSNSGLDELLRERPGTSGRTERAAAGRFDKRSANCRDGNARHRKRAG